MTIIIIRYHNDRMSPILLSQNDPRWKDKLLGTANGTIGMYGCTITAIAMKFGVTPDFLNERLLTVNGYLNGNLVIWKKIEEALPGVTFIYKYSQYDNEMVKKNIPCIVEVDASPIGGSRHWVLFIGNQQLYDPWDGKQKSTGTYKPLSFVLVNGEYKNQSEQSKTPEVLSEPTVPLSQYQNLQKVYDTLQTNANELVETNKEMSDSLKNYAEMKLLGYTSIDDINKALAAKDTLNLTLQTEIAQVRQRNAEALKMVSDIESEDHVTHEQAVSLIDEHQALKETLREVGKAGGVDRLTTNNVVASVFRLKDLADRFLKKIDEEAIKKSDTVISSPEVKQKVTPATDWFLTIFQLGKGVK